jgi:hypothetical protein
MPSFRRTKLGLLVAVGVVASFVAVPAVAVGQDPLSNPSDATYATPIPSGGVAGTGAGGGGGGAPAGAQAGGSVAKNASGGGPGSKLGGLPFTGMDLIIVAGVALMLTGTGLALRRLSAPGARRV